MTVKIQPSAQGTGWDARRVQAEPFQGYIGRIALDERGESQFHFCGIASGSEMMAIAEWMLEMERQNRLNSNSEQVEKELARLHRKDQSNGRDHHADRPTSHDIVLPVFTEPTMGNGHRPN